MDGSRLVAFCGWMFQGIRAGELKWLFVTPDSQRAGVGGIGYEGSLHRSLQSDAASQGMSMRATRGIEEVRWRGASRRIPARHAAQFELVKFSTSGVLASVSRARWCGASSAESGRFGA